MGEGQEFGTSSQRQDMAKTMSVSSFRRAESRFGVEPVCKHCEELIRVGQSYYSPRRRNHGRRYHWTCAQKLNIV